MSDLKILLFDLECSMASGYFYGLYDQNISIENIIEHPRVIAFSAKWLGKKQVIFKSEFHDGRKEMLQELHDLLSGADLVAGWNSDRFDIPWIQGEFIVEGMKPPAPFKRLDLMKATKKTARFISNKLDYVANRIIGSGKIDYNMAQMWRIVNDPNTDEKTRKREWDAMRKYAKRDVEVLEPLFNELLPWLTLPHPRSSDENACHNCGGTHLQRRGTVKTMYSEYDRLYCVDCGKWLRGTTRKGVTNFRGVQ